MQGFPSGKDQGSDDWKLKEGQFWFNHPSLQGHHHKLVT